MPILLLGRTATTKLCLGSSTHILFLLTRVNLTIDRFKSEAYCWSGISSDQGRMDGPSLLHRELALTFDDGPHPVHTPRLLNVLAHYGVKATFFLVGQNLRTPSGQKLLKRIVEEGHVVGNHSYSHADLTGLTESKIKAEILRTADVLQSVSGPVLLFRPPYGAHNRLVDEMVRETGHRMLFWNVDSMDWYENSQPHEISQRCLEAVGALEKSMILGHDIHPHTVRWVESFLESTSTDSCLVHSLNYKTLESWLDSIPAIWGTGPRRYTRLRRLLRRSLRTVLPQYGEVGK